MRQVRERMRRVPAFQQNPRHRRMNAAKKIERQRHRIPHRRAQIEQASEDAVNLGVAVKNLQFLADVELYRVISLGAHRKRPFDQGDGAIRCNRPQQTGRAG